MELRSFIYRWEIWWSKYTVVACLHQAAATSVAQSVSSTVSSVVWRIAHYRRPLAMNAGEWMW